MSNVKTSRESSTREKLTRKKDWTPPSSLDAPPAPNGYSHRWIRTTVQGFEDTANVSKKMREGWEFVKVEQVQNEIGTNKYPYYTEGKYEGCIGIGGLVLARIPEELAQQREAYYQQMTADRTEALDNDVLKEQHPSMPINQERQTRVTFGGTKK